MYVINTIPHGKCFVRYLRHHADIYLIKSFFLNLGKLIRQYSILYALVVVCIRTYSFAALTRSISDTSKLVLKYRTPALSM